MKLQNNTNKGIMVPLPEEPTKSFVTKPFSHMPVLPGEIKEIPEKAVEWAKKNGLTEVKAEESSIGNKSVETKKLDRKGSKKEKRSKR